MIVIYQNNIFCSVSSFQVKIEMSQMWQRKYRLLFYWKILKSTIISLNMFRKKEIEREI